MSTSPRCQVTLLSDRTISRHHVPTRSQSDSPKQSCPQKGTPSRGEWPAVLGAKGRMSTRLSASLLPPVAERAFKEREVF